MTKKQLIAALEPYADDAEVILEVWEDEDLNHLGDLNQVSLSESCASDEKPKVMLVTKIESYQNRYV